MVLSLHMQPGEAPPPNPRPAPAQSFGQFLSTNPRYPGHPQITVFPSTPLPPKPPC